MLPYFPPAYPDELLYSLLARFYRHVGKTSPKRTLDVLFGNRSVRAGVLLQGHLQALSEELPPHRGLTPERLLADFTLYPYLTAFQPENVRRAVCDALFLGRAEWVTVRLGLAASRVQGATVLRYCPACRSEMLVRYCELYWCRDHQLPGAAVCPEHGVRLQDSTVCPGAIGQFRLRRVAWAAEELRRRNLPLKSWRLRRLAGLPEQASPQVEAALKAYEGP